MKGLLIVCGRFAIAGLSAFSVYGSEPEKLIVGDGQIDGSKLHPYSHTWHVCALQEDRWVAQPNITEELVVIGDQVLRQRQTSTRDNGVMTVATNFFSQQSFAPLRMEVLMQGPDGSLLGQLIRQLDETGYTGVTRQADKEKTVNGKLTSQMLHGGALGLPLVTLSKRKNGVQFAASMMSFDGTYQVEAAWVGTDNFEFEGKQIAANMVDVKWLHHESGDVYPPGPNASGGRYWLVSEPPAGFPYVPKYVTDTYAIEFQRNLCEAPE